MGFLESTGWLEDDFAEGDFASGYVTNGPYCQVEMRIDKTTNHQVQVEQSVGPVEHYPGQSELRIDTTEPVRSEVQRQINLEGPYGAQVEFMPAALVVLRAQAERKILGATEELRAEVQRIIVDALNQRGVQVDLRVGGTTEVQGGQIYSSNILYVISGGFLTGPFGEDTWLTDHVSAHLRGRVELQIDKTNAIGAQVDLEIDDKRKVMRGQVELRIDTEIALGAQVDRVFIGRLASQVTIVLYNTTRPRILCEFASRGLDGNNWTASSTEPGDFSVLNVNNDIVELYWRSAAGIKTSIILTSDTQIPQGVFLDTLYVDGHNLTTSAVVTLEGSNVADFSSVGLSENLIVQTGKIFYVAPTLPITSFRYFRLQINDPTNSEDHIRIGFIGYGSAKILDSTCSTQDIIVATREFKNTVRSEGFTTIGNSRAVKRSVRLDFRDIQYSSGDYDKLVEVKDYARTTLKCLWIPDPRTQSLMKRFSAFGKLTQMPEERHSVRGREEFEDTIDMSFEIDEAE